MTLVGKIFTMLIFILSIVFMAFSIMVFATHRNWKAFATATSTQLALAQTAKKDADELLQKLKNQLAEEQAARRAALAALQVRAARAEQEQAAVQQKFDELSAQHTLAAEAAKTAQERLAALEAETTKLRDEKRAVERDLNQKFLAVVDLTDKLNQAQSQLEILSERNKESVIQIGRMKDVLTKHGLTETTLVDHIPPKVEGVVLEVSDKDLVEISIGADDGMKVGHALDVYRDNTYLGRLVIRRTAPDRSVGQMLKELQRGQIKRGDRVTSKFS